MAHTYTQLLFHIVFSTKDRHPWLTADIRSRVHDYLGGAIRSEGGHSILIGGVDDHVHLFAKLRQDKAISDIIRNIKANSSGWIHKTFPLLRDFEWQRGYGAFTVSFSQSPKLKTYIANQEEHHKKQSYREECLILLRNHGVEVDEQYLWE